MARIDLLSLSVEDLELLSNRGTVKRAKREVDDKEVSFDLEESSEGDVTIQWSDSVKCKLPFNKTLKEAQCTCAIGSLCRHIVRSVFAYQLVSSVVAAAPATTDSVDTETEGADGAVGAVAVSSAVLTASAAEVWDPGDIGDAELSKYFKPASLTKAKKSFDEGQVVELVRAIKPFARFHSLSYTLKFLVPNDLRYTHCDCAEDPPPCSHVPVAIWAFRSMNKSTPSGVVSTAKMREPAPIKILDAIELLLLDLTILGISGITQALLGRMKRIVEECIEGGLIWPSEILNELIIEVERYLTSDARYSANHVAELFGEMIIRCDAIRSATDALPQMFIRGSCTDRASDMSSARLIGLGCGGRVNRKSLELTAYFQDLSTGNVVTFRREFDTRDEKEITPFWRLAAKPVVKAVSVALLGSGQILTKGGKLSPSREWNPGRTAMSVNRQMYKWESLKAPVYAENFAELRAVIAARPPSFVGPRYTGTNFYVCAVQQAANAQYSELEQAVEAVLLDAAGERALLISPYITRCAEGTEVLLHHLKERGGDLRFVAGPVLTSGKSLIFQPVSLVFDNGQTRTLVQPWIDREESLSQAISVPPPELEPGTSCSALREFPVRLLEQLGQTLTIGLERTDSEVARRWLQLRKDSEATGFSLMVDLVSRISVPLESKKSQLDWDGAEVARHLLAACVVSVVAKEEAGVVDGSVGF